jgi:RNase P subunit RPR2
MTCKRCETPIIPAITSTTRIKCKFFFINLEIRTTKLLLIAKPVATAIQTCKICKAKRRYTCQNPNYELFSQRTDSVHVEDDQTV